jgi:hypothetical protein
MVSPTYAAIARRREEAGMLDTCTIRAVARGGDSDPLTGLVPASGAVIYDGPCEFVAANTQARSVDSAGRDVVEQGAVLKLPVDAPGSDAVRSGHTAEVRVAALDHRTLNVRVVGDHTQTYAASRRLPVEVTSRVR